MFFLAELAVVLPSALAAIMAVASSAVGVRRRSLDVTPTWLPLSLGVDEVDVEEEVLGRGLGLRLARERRRRLRETAGTIWKKMDR